MPDVFGLADVSSKDTGRGSSLKTGGIRRKNNMKKSKCKVGQVYDQKLKKCKDAPNRQKSARKQAEGKQKIRKFMGGARKAKSVGKAIKELSKRGY